MPSLTVGFRMSETGMMSVEAEQPLSSRCMKTDRKKSRPPKPDAFSIVREVGLSLPGVEEMTRYDGSPVLKVNGMFVAALASHWSAEPNTLVVRTELDERELMLADCPDTYYVTDFYRNYPLVLARLARLPHDALRDLIATSWRITKGKAKKGTVVKRSPMSRAKSLAP